jgi:hypothetical protein
VSRPSNIRPPPENVANADEKSIAVLMVSESPTFPRIPKLATRNVIAGTLLSQLPPLSTVNLQRLRILVKLFF